MYGTFNKTENKMEDAVTTSLKDENPPLSGDKATTTPEEPITFEDLGIRIVPTTRRTIFGTVQTCRSLKPTEISFLILSIISFCLSLGLTIQRLVTLDKTSDDYTFAILLLLTTGFCLYYAIDGIFMERFYEIMVCICSTLIVMIYCVLNYAYGDKILLKLIRMVVALILGFAVMGVGGVVIQDYIKSGDLIFRTVGGNMGLHRACHVLFLVSSLLGFDLQLEVSMLVFVMRNGVNLGDLEKIVLSVGVPVSVLWIILGCLASRLENKMLSVIFLLTFWAEPAYVIYKFISLNEIHSQILRYSIIACGTSALVVRTSLMIAYVFVMRNYGKGLKEKIYGRFAN